MEQQLVACRASRPELTLPVQQILSKHTSPHRPNLCCCRSHTPTCTRGDQVCGDSKEALGSDISFVSIVQAAWGQHARIRQEPTQNLSGIRGAPAYWRQHCDQILYRSIAMFLPLWRASGVSAASPPPSPLWTSWTSMPKLSSWPALNLSTMWQHGITSVLRLHQSIYQDFFYQCAFAAAG